jgi:uncharacterized protein (TIGR02118 family)
VIKVMVLLSRKEGLTREQFKQYYEERHAPLIASLLRSVVQYKRNYPLLEGAHFPPPQQDTAFDSATEIWFDNRAGYDAFVRAVSDPETLRKIREDEANFLDHTKTCRFVVDECSTDLGAARRL